MISCNTLPAWSNRSMVASRSVADQASTPIQPKAIAATHIENFFIYFTVFPYQALLKEVKTCTLKLRNCDLDDGKPTAGEEYSLADDAYADLLTQLAANKFEGVTPELRANILAFYFDMSAPIATRQNQAHWQALQDDLHKLSDAQLTQDGGNPAPAAHRSRRLRRRIFCVDQPQTVILCDIIPRPSNINP